MARNTRFNTTVMDYGKYLKPDRMVKYFQKMFVRCFRKYTIIILLITFLSSVLFTSNSMSSVRDGNILSQRDKALGIHFIDYKTGWIVGDNGLVLKTTDGGEIWQKLAISDESLNDIFFVKENGWIVGSGGLILHTVNGGKSWGKQKSHVEVSLMRVVFPGKDKGFVVGADGSILKTLNGGLTWEIVDFDWIGNMPEELLGRGVISINLYDIFFINESSGWIVGDWGTILHSEDGGEKWSIINIGSFPSLYSISFNEDQIGWAVGQNGFSLKTKDGGVSWEKAVIEKKYSLYRICISDGYGAIVGDQGTMYESNDNGVNWAKVQTDFHPPYPWMADAWILPSNSAKIVSVGKGVILKTKILSKKHGDDK